MTRNQFSGLAPAVGLAVIYWTVALCAPSLLELDKRPIHSYSEFQALPVWEERLRWIRVLVDVTVFAILIWLYARWGTHRTKSAFALVLIGTTVGLLGVLFLPGVLVK